VINGGDYSCTSPPNDWRQKVLMMIVNDDNLLSPFSLFRDS